MIDIVFPQNNEEEFIKLAEELGYSGICFVYALNTFKKIKAEAKLKIFTAIIADEKSTSRAKSVSDLVIVKSTDSDRNLLESGRFDIIFGLETVAKKDYIHHRASGLNQVHCELLQKNSISVGISFNTILRSEGMLRSQILGRIMQNIMFARKYKFNVVMSSFAKSPFEMRSPHDLEAFLVALGMHPAEAKQALENTESVLRQSMKRKSPSYICEGIELVE